MQAVISDGHAQIDGNFTTESASSLSSLIRGGALPVNFHEIESSVTTATLGEAALQDTVKGGIIGVVLVILFMLVLYRLPGLMADIALIGYILIIAYSYVFLKATITMPGIAALILSVGMAVDANVIIFERIKEEMRLGKSVRVSIESGFSKALSTILDWQITTFIAGVVLYNFGTGPIKGFAMTLMIGILASIFTAVIVTKALLKNFVAGFSITDTKLFGVNTESNNKTFHIDVIGKKKIFFKVILFIVKNIKN